MTEIDRSFLRDEVETKREPKTHNIGSMRDSESWRKLICTNQTTYNINKGRGLDLVIGDYLEFTDVPPGLEAPMICEVFEITPQDINHPKSSYVTLHLRLITDNPVSEAIRVAQSRLYERGASKGQRVAYPEDPYAYTIESMRGDTTVLVRPDKSSKTECAVVRKTVDTRKLFDPNTQELMDNVVQNILSSQMPKASEKIN